MTMAYDATGDYPEWARSIHEDIAKRFPAVDMATLMMDHGAALGVMAAFGGVRRAMRIYEGDDYADRLHNLLTGEYHSNQVIAP